MTAPARAVFLDRDGTVSEEVGYMYSPSAYMVFPWTGPAIRRLNDAGFLVVLTTNQSGVGRGYFTRTMVDQVHDILRGELDRAGGRLDAAYVCPHRPAEGCTCRKPLPGMLTRARDELDISLEDSFMIGDRYTDVAAGKAAGTRTILVLTGDGRTEHAAHRHAGPQPDLVADSLAEAVDAIIASKAWRRTS